MCPPWCGSLPELLLLPNFLPCLSPIFGGCLHLCVPFCLPFVWFRSFVSCLQLCWLRWHTSTTLVLHFFYVCLPACRGLMSILSYHLSSIRPYLSTTGPLLALACLLRAVLMSFSPRLFHCLSLRCCLASWGFTSTCLLIVTYLFVYLNLIHLIIIFHVCTRSVWGSRL